MLRTILQSIKFTMIAFTSVLAVYFLLAFILPQIKVNRGFKQTPGGVTNYFCSNGVHTDVALPVKTEYIDWRQPFPPATFKAVDTTFKYIEVGWGDKAFYLNTPTWADLKFSTAFNALFFLDSSAMHVTYDKLAPVPAPNYCKQITISPQQYKQLIAYIRHSFNLHGGRVAVLPGKGYGVTDNFYEANGHYSFAKTCNVWTCGALKSAGIEQGLWSPLEGGVMKGYSP